MSGPTCQYCGAGAWLIGGKYGYVWKCDPCGARVGCHPGTKRPLGHLANAELRSARMAAHDAFDPRWKGQPSGVRSEAYEWLAEQLKIARDDCHIALFDLEQCRRVVELCAVDEFVDSS